jgi:hypothetical protein
MEVELAQRMLSVGSYYRIGWHIITRYWLHIFLLILVFAVPATVIEAMLYALWDVDPNTLQNAGYGVLASSIAAIIVLCADMYVIRLTAEWLRGEEPDAPRLWSSTLRLFPSAIAVNLVYGFLVIVGLILFFVPGFYLAVVFSFVLFFLVLDRAGIWTCFGLSRALVRGHFWHVLGVLIALVLPNLIGVLLISWMVADPASNFVASLLSSVYSLYATVMGTVFFLNARAVWGAGGQENEISAADINEVVITSDRGV